MQEMKEPMRRYVMKLTEVGVSLLFLVIALSVFAHVLNYIMPFVIGFLIAAVLLPVATFFESFLPRAIAISGALVVSLGGLLAVIVFLLVQGAGEATSLAIAIPRYFGMWKQVSQYAIEQGMAVYAHLPLKMVEAVQTTVNTMVDQARQFALTLLSGFVGEVALLPDLIVIIVISVVAAYFFLAQREMLLQGMRRWLPPGWGPKVEEIAGDVWRAVIGLFRAQLVLIGVTSVICVIGLAVMGVQYALLLGVGIGLTGWVPIVGSGIITIPWVVGALVTGKVILAIKILLLQAVASVVRHTIEPKLLASNMGIGTFATMFGMYVGLTSLGILGLLLGPLLMIAIRSLLRERIFDDFFPASILPREEAEKERT